MVVTKAGVVLILVDGVVELFGAAAATERFLGFIAVAFVVDVMVACVVF